MQHVSEALTAGPTSFHLMSDKVHHLFDPSDTCPSLAEDHKNDQSHPILPYLFIILGLLNLDQLFTLIYQEKTGVGKVWRAQKRSMLI